MHQNKISYFDATNRPRFSSASYADKIIRLKALRPHISMSLPFRFSYVLDYTRNIYMCQTILFLFFAFLFIFSKCVYVFLNLWLYCTIFVYRLNLHCIFKKAPVKQALFFITCYFSLIIQSLPAASAFLFLVLL